MNKLQLFLCGGVVILLAQIATLARAADSRPFQDLWIPPALTGKSFDLALGKSSKSFWPGATTDTYGFNKAQFWGPTLILEKGDTVKINVRNDLDETTTVHWHGMHLPAAADGGPYQPVAAGATWSSSFTVKNNAGTFWYHPHPHQATQKQITMGAGGFIIVKDPEEARLRLPRTYGVDDIPLVLTSRRFHTNQQFSFEGDNDKYGDFEFTNGTLDAQVSLPAQFVRLRILNAEIERGYILGFSDNRTYYIIATDGGLVDKPIPVNRMKLMVGERVEVLVELSKDKPGSSLDLMAYNAGQPFGFPGGEPGRTRPNGGYLNNIDFRLLHINVAAHTDNPITELPQVLTHNQFPSMAEVSNRRTFQVASGAPVGEFAFAPSPFSMNDYGQVQIVKLGATEAWTISNSRVFGHSFHIHDVQFKIVSRSNGPVEAYEQGWKDTVYVPRGQSVTFVAKFEDFASDTEPYMYHCHMANHEDTGLMGDFLVVKDPASINRTTLKFRERLIHPVTAELSAVADRQAQKTAPNFDTSDIDGNPVSLKSLSATNPVILFFIERDCPCSRDAAPFIDQLQTAYGQSCTVVGVINADPGTARAWAKTAGIHFRLIADPDMSIIKAYDARRSVYTTLITPGGSIAKTYPGYSATMLDELSKAVGHLGNAASVSLSTVGAPKQLLTGCEF